MAVTAQKQLFSVTDYHKMAEVGILKPDARVELIRGEIIKMSPIKSAHAGMVNFLLEYLIINLHKKYTVIGQNPIQIDEFSEPEPDIAIAAYREDRYRSTHPTATDVLLIIEVADSSLEYDRTVKKMLYAESGIPEYWIVNLTKNQVEVFMQPLDRDYEVQEVYSANERIACLELEIELKELFR
jgi:hypothetical protein